MRSAQVESEAACGLCRGFADLSLPRFRRAAPPHAAARGGHDEISFTLIFHGGHRSRMPNALICPDAFLSPLEIDAVASRALQEDLGRAGDVTSTATIPEHTTARASVIARERGIVSGLPLLAAALTKPSPTVP